MAAEGAAARDHEAGQSSGDARDFVQWYEAPSMTARSIAVLRKSCTLCAGSVRGCGEGVSQTRIGSSKPRAAEQATGGRTNLGRRVCSNVSKESLSGSRSTACAVDARKLERTC
jgi:hypothetical protein